MQDGDPFDLATFEARRVRILREEREALERLAREDLRLAHVDEQAALDRVDTLRTHIGQTPDPRTRVALFHRMLDACQTLVTAGHAVVEALDRLAEATNT